jgi:hypothetical protein
MDKPSFILGNLDICGSNGQGWSEKYILKNAEIVQAKTDFVAICRYRAACLASEYSLVSGHLEFANNERPHVPVITRPLNSPWTRKILPLLTTLNVAIACHFQTEGGRKINRFFHGLGRAGRRKDFLKAIEQVYDSGAIPPIEILSCPEDGVRAFFAMLRDKTVYAKTDKADRVTETTPWRNVVVIDINLDVDPELPITEKKEADMLPRLTSPSRCKTLKAVQVGPLRLIFELPRHHQVIPSLLVGFVVDGQPPCVCARAGYYVKTEQFLSAIEPDRSKWLPETEFARKWLEISQNLLREEVPLPAHH